MPRTGLDDRAMVGVGSRGAQVLGPLGGQVVALLSLGIVAHVSGASLRGHLAAGMALRQGALGLHRASGAGLPAPPTRPQPRRAGSDGRWTPASLSALVALRPHCLPAGTKVTLHPTHDLGEPRGDLDSASATYFPASLMRKVSKTVTVPELPGGQRKFLSLWF